MCGADSPTNIKAIGSIPTHAFQLSIVICLSAVSLSIICPEVCPRVCFPGFGATTPQTVGGRVFVVLYGILGCSAGILFFNLFLERIITFLAYILRALHDFKVRLKEDGGEEGGAPGRRDSIDSSSDSLDAWKPSVYWVMLILIIGAVIIATAAAGMYSSVEGWSYWDSIYFCFVAFATVGFGDFVPAQKTEQDNAGFYALGNFLFLVVGCCFTYSLFNVTSIVIKQGLNWLIQKLDCDCCFKDKQDQRPRRNAITPNHLHDRKDPRAAPDLSVVNSSEDSAATSRRDSREFISMRDLLQNNKISLAQMQKQLYETAQRGMRAHMEHESQAGEGLNVGPLMMLNQKLGQEDA